MTYMPRSGGCQCGAIRFQILDAPRDPHLCHCRMCQKQFGGFYAALACVPRSKFRMLRGEIANFRSSAKVQRGFCKDCGTPLTYDPFTTDIIAFAIPALDDYSDIKPLNQCGVEARQTWVQSLHILPQFVTGRGSDGSNFTDNLPAIAKSNRQHPDYDTENWPLKRS